MTGRVVILNGPSSAGKSTCATEFALQMATPWHYLPVDLVHSIRSRPAAMTDVPHSDPQWQSVFRSSRAAYHRMLAALAATGNDVVGDHVLNEPWRLDDLLHVLDGIPVLLVHLTATDDALRAREIARGDRVIGTAGQQRALVFEHGGCDLSVDTTSKDPVVVAAQVRELVENWPQETAFDRLRRAQPHS